MKKLFLVLILGISMAACTGAKKNISADECGSPGKDQKTTLSKKQQGISADECGSPKNNRKTKLTKDQSPDMTAD